MPSKKPHACPICHRPGLINLSQHLSGAHRIGGQERKQLIQRGMVGSEVMVTEPQSHIEKHITFLGRLQFGERLRIYITDEKSRTRRIESRLRTLFEHE